MDAKPLQRYSREQILLGLKQIMRGITSSEQPFDADTGIDAYLNAVGEEELGYLELCYGIEEHFGLRFGNAQWEEYMNSARKASEESRAEARPRFTFGHLADFIAARVEVVPFEPVTILGRPCDAAGAFRAIETIAQHARPKIASFGPSTTIRRVLFGGAMERFWSRLRWMTEGTVPPLRTTILTKAGTACAVLGFFGCPLLLCCMVVQTIAFEWGQVKFLCLASLGVGGGAFVVRRVLDRLDNRLPDGVRTFRDLAVLVAAAPAFRRATGSLPDQGENEIREESTA